MNPSDSLHSINLKRCKDSKNLKREALHRDYVAKCV